MNNFKDLKGYEGYYKINEEGVVISVDRTCVRGRGALSYLKGQIIKPRKDRYGYLNIKVSKNAIRKRTTVHRLVAINFIPNPENKPQVNHLDGNKENNHISNLEWCTGQENINHAVLNNLRGSKKGYKIPYKVQQILRRKPVKQLSLEGEIIKIWESQIIAAEALKLQNTHISGCCKGISKTHGGFKWEFV